MTPSQSGESDDATICNLSTYPRYGWILAYQWLASQGDLCEKECACNKGEAAQEANLLAPIQERKHMRSNPALLPSSQVMAN